MAGMQYKFAKLYANDVITTFLTLWNIEKSFNYSPSFTDEENEANRS